MGNEGGSGRRRVQWRGLEWVWMRLSHAIVQSRAGGRVVQKNENRAAGARFVRGGAKRRLEEAEGGPMEGARTGLDEVVTCRGPGGAGK